MTISSARIVRMGLSFLVTLILVILSDGCKKKETTVEAAPENLLDPAVTPRVLYTYPQDGTVGPFNVYTPTIRNCCIDCYSSACNVPGHFLVQFNKMMSSESMSSQNIHCAGPGSPVRVAVRNNYNILPLQNVFEFVLYRETPTSGYSIASYELGKTYTVTFDTGVTDGNGMHLVRPWSFSFTPEPVFRMLETSPRTGDSIAINHGVFVQFNSPIDTTVLTKMHFLPPVPGTWQINGTDSEQIYFFPSQGFFQESAYSLTIANDVHDRAGNLLQGNRSIAFRTYPFNVAATTPARGDTLRTLNSNIQIQMTGPVLSGSIAYGVTIQPPFGTLRSSGNWIYMPNQDHDLQPATRYTVDLNSSLMSTDNTTLQTPYSFWFVTPKFKLYSSTPSNGNSYIGKTDPIRATYTGRLDSASIAGSFSIDPPVPGHFVIASRWPTGYSFSPDTFYSVGTKYRVVLGTSLRSIDGYSPARPDTITFIPGQ